MFVGGGRIFFFSYLVFPRLAVVKPGVVHVVALHLEAQVIIHGAELFVGHLAHVVQPLETVQTLRVLVVQHVVAALLQLEIVDPPRVC